MSSEPKYIVVFKDSATKEQIEKYVNEVNANGGQVTNRYDGVLNGFAAHIPESFMSNLRSDTSDLIDYIEPDGVATIQQQ